MKAKLIKTENGYGLKDCDLIAFVSTVRTEHRHHKLSLKNCQAIERGYDLDELAIQMYPANNSFGQTSLEQKERRKGFKKGFQKALEILGDKKFSEDNLDKAFELGHDVEREDCNDNYLRYKQSLQQTEWEVEVETVPALSNNGNVYYGDIPKLDADGCLILKRVVK